MEEGHRARSVRVRSTGASVPRELGWASVPDLHMFINLEALDSVLLGSYGVLITQARLIKSLALAD